MLTSADPSAAASYAIATVVQMRHDDKAEAFFLASLLAMMNQDSFTEPVAVAIYGQGRAHTALVGSQINDRNITSACQYVSGECSCTIKAQSPGCDLLLKANWPAPDIEVPALEVIDLPPVDTATPSRYTSQPSILTHDGATRNIQKAQPVTADLRAPPSSRIIHTAIMSLMIVAGLSISVAAVVFLRTSHIRP
jgi:hypothetical protein